MITLNWEKVPYINCYMVEDNNSLSKEEEGVLF
jgi:hypothetical protein